MHVAHPKPNINIAPRPTSYLEVCPVAPLPSPDKLPRGGAAAATPLVRVRVGRRASSGDYVKVFFKKNKNFDFKQSFTFSLLSREPWPSGGPFYHNAGPGGGPRRKVCAPHEKEEDHVGRHHVKRPVGKHMVLAWQVGGGQNKKGILSLVCGVD